MGPHAEVDEVEDLQAQVVEVVVDLRLEIVRIQRAEPAAGRIASASDLGGDVKFPGVRAEGLPDDPVRDRGP
jgi:hypothetical protein